MTKAPAKISNPPNFKAKIQKILFLPAALPTGLRMIGVVVVVVVVLVVLVL